MDTFVDSSWYFMRYTDAHNDEAPWDPEVLARWMPVDQYIGGVEHAILHLMYARFFTKALADLGYLNFQEPFARLFTQGMITRDGAKMSKSRGNVISPQTYIERYGADTARAYILFIGPPDQDADWSDAGVEGVHRFLARLWRMSAETADQTPDHPIPDELSEADEELLRKANWAIEKVTNDMAGRFAFNTAIAAIMELTNTISKQREEGDPSPGALRFALATAASLLFPFAPHTAADAHQLLDRSPRLGGAVAGHRPALAASATPTSSCARSTARSAIACRRRRALRARSSRRCAWPRPRSRPTSTARTWSRSSSCPSAWSTSSCGSPLGRAWRGE